MEIERHGSVSILRPQRDWLLPAMSYYEEKINNEITQGTLQIVLSGALINYMGACGLRLLAQKALEIRKRQGDIKLAVLSYTLVHVLKLCGYIDAFEIYPSESDAICSFGANLSHLERLMLLN